MEDTGMNDLDPSGIELQSTSKMFEYEKLSREIEECNSVETLKRALRCYIKLHMRHQEIVTQMIIDK